MKTPYCPCCFKAFEMGKNGFPALPGFEIWCECGKFGFETNIGDPNIIYIKIDNCYCLKFENKKVSLVEDKEMPMHSVFTANITFPSWENVIKEKYFINVEEKFNIKNIVEISKKYYEKFKKILILK